MSAYGPLARWYDALTADVPYDSFADYYEAAFARRGGAVHSVLDLCCGTGTLACILARRGYDLVCTDASADMLSVFRDKCERLDEGAKKPLLLCQEAAALDLYGTVDAAYCSLDSFNYLSPAELPEVLRRLRLFIAPGGSLVFDINSPGRLRSLDGQSFVDEAEGLLCLWRVCLDEKAGALHYGLDVFSKSGRGLWRREQEEHVQYVHEPEWLLQLREEAGFTEPAIDRSGPQSGQGRLFLSARRPD
jgi:SAM-dependent methyltransferase